jgi:hypothetical protein
LESPGSTRDVADEKTGRRAAATSPAFPIPAILPAAPTPITPHPFFIVHTPSPQGRRAPAPLPPDWRTITPAPSHPPHKKTNTKPTTNAASSVSLCLSPQYDKHAYLMQSNREKNHTRDGDDDDNSSCNSEERSETLKLTKRKNQMLIGLDVHLRDSTDEPHPRFPVQGLI